MPRRSPVPLAALAVASALLFAGCASGQAGATDDGRVQVVASTNVYGQIAEAIGGDAVDVVSIIDSVAQDPHSYEASARDQLTVSRADLIIENGGGYDPFVDSLIDATGAEAPVLTAVEFSQSWTGGSAHDDDSAGESGDDDSTSEPHDDHADDGHDHADDGGHDHDRADHGHVEGFNEHVWYDLTAMGDLAQGIAARLSALSPDDADVFEENAQAFVSALATPIAGLADLAAAHGGQQIFVTEPVPLYLTGAAGLVDVTPAAFSEAVEEGQDVPPATLLEGLELLRSGDVRAVIVNAQTGGAETDAVVQEAESRGIPVLSFSEVLPEGLTYVEWMQQNVDDLGKALGG
jgi:zinc/manganese transport system substrate-binding protein